MAYAEAASRTDEADAPKPKGKKTTLVESGKAAQKWQRELDSSKRWMQRFVKAARECERQYIGVSDTTGSTAPTSMGKVNLFWSNVQVILSAIYGRLPKAEVDRKFGDFDDDVSRVAGIIMQRVLNGDIERDYDDTNAAMRDAVQDRFIAGLGQVWCRYEVDTEMQDQPVTDPATGQPIPGATQQVEAIINEEAQTDYVYWDDFRYAPCRRWRECRWVARRVYMSEPKLKARFKLDEKQLGMIPMTTREPINTDSPSGTEDVLKATPFKQAAVWEVWERERNYVCWFVEGCSFVLDQQPDPLELDDFFPCPMPITATTLTKAFLPRPDYAMVQDLYKELDRVNAKLAHLTEAVKAVGVYDKTAMAARKMLAAGTENELIPVENWSAFVEKGGMKGVIDWMPIEQFVAAIAQLTARKNQLQHDLYEVMGISDIMRGASVASETATAQQLKVQYGGARLANLQNDVARFVSDVMRIRANIVSNLFQPQTILKRSLIERTPDAQYAQPAIQLLKDFGTAMYSITVTADSLAAPDWAQEKEARTEFLGAASNFVMAAAPVVQADPMTGSFLIKLLQWAAAGFKGAKTIEGVLDQAAKALTEKAQQPPQPEPPTPEDKKNTAQAGKYDAEAERTKKEAALIPPIGMPAGGLPPMTPGGPQPGGPPGLPAGPGSVPPMQPQMPAPLNGAPM